MRTLSSLALACACITVTLAQRPTIEYGSPSDLKGVKKIFVDTGTEMEVRENILKELGKSKKKTPDLEVVSRPEDAEIILAFGASASTYLAQVNTAPVDDGAVVSHPVYRQVVHGDGVVLKPLGENRVRLLMSFKDSRSSRFERRPSTNFAREFIHKYMDANGIKR
jgi:hypothetical protein